MSNFELPFDGSTDDGGIAFNITEEGGGIAIRGSSLVQAAGPLGFRNLRRRRLDAAGVRGESDGFPGVSGKSDADSGVEGESSSGPGIQGRSDTGRGVVGHSHHLDGVQGLSDLGTGVFGEGERHGVQGKSGGGSAVYGQQTAGGEGVRGTSVSGTGVLGTSVSGTGVYGYSAEGTGVYGQSDAVLGKAGFFEGDVAVTGDLCLVNGDCAEDFEVVDPADASAGSVMVFVEGGRVASCRLAYDRRVGGIVAGAGGTKPAIILGRSTNSPTRRPLALIGRVYCKVDASHGPVEVGDLLTTSPTPGHAMKASDPTRAFGATIGKAIAELQTGCGLVPVLVSLR